MRLAITFQTLVIKYFNRYMCMYQWIDNHSFNSSSAIHTGWWCCTCSIDFSPCSPPPRNNKLTRLTPPPPGKWVWYRISSYENISYTLYCTTISVSGITKNFWSLKTPISGLFPWEEGGRGEERIMWGLCYNNKNLLELAFWTSVYSRRIAKSAYNHWMRPGY